MWHSRTFWRLFGTFSVLLLCSIVLLGAIMVSRFERLLLRQIEESLRTKAILIRDVVRDMPGGSGEPLQQRVQALGREVVTRITLLAGDGRVLADTDENPSAMENHADRPEVRAAHETGFGAAVRYSDTLKQSMMYVALPAPESTGKDSSSAAVGFVRVALPLQEVQAELDGLRRFVWTTAAVTGIGVLVLALWPARRLAKPLRDLARRVERLAAGEPGRKIYTGDAGEVGALARTFNRLSDRLSDQLAQIEAERQQLRAVLGGMIEGVVALDDEQRILFVNDRAAQLLEFQPAAGLSSQGLAAREVRGQGSGAREKEQQLGSDREPVGAALPMAALPDGVTGRRFWEVVRQRALHDLVRKTLAGADVGSQELAWTGHAAKSLTVRAAKLTGPRPGAVLVLHDTTELRRLERLRGEFFANVSHELKTPLSVIKACLETLSDGAAADPEFAKRFLDRATHNADRLQALVQDLLSLTRIESGAEAFEFQPVPLDQVVADCLERQREHAERKQQVLEAIPPPAEDKETRRQGDKELESTDVVAWADEEAVGQILDNLVSNAVKYTPEGGQIRVRWWDEESEACVEVADSGIGIPEADLPRVFERFYRVDRARSRELGGTGLGLAIVKHLTQAMHGSVHAASRPGQGSKFTVRLPLSK
jgi:two-component system, OmpR family, phosphate regulon sensor histidine kinase PhoR